jgi:transcriptional regulator with XRE-family HTH domain
LTGTPQPTLTESGNQIFGKALAHWLEQTGKGHKEVADRIQVRVSALSHWLAGRKRPSPLRLLRLLIHLHAWLGPDWTVADALDTIAPLGWSWEDVRQALETLQEKEARTFRDWWEKGKPQPPPLSPPDLPAWYVEREEQHRLREMLTDWADWRQARWRGIVVTGVAGAGKTTLLFALAQDPSVRRAFRDGILWLKGSENDLLDQAADRIGLVGSPRARREKWAQWATAPHRRLLIVVDDGLPDEDLDTLAATLGPQAVLVVTTQKGPEVMAAIERWIPREHRAEILLRGLREEEGFSLIAQVLGTPVREPDRETVRQIGHLLGWHPEGLRIAAAMAGDIGEQKGRRAEEQRGRGAERAEERGAEEQRSGGAEEPDWAGVLAFLEEERLKGGEWDPLRRLVERQWERMGEVRRRRVEQLVWRTVRGGPLGEHLAGALWGVRPEVARHLLRDLERTGLVERVTAHPLEWWREGKVEMWRVTPVVFHLRREAGEQSAQEKELQRWRRRAVFQKAWAAHLATPPMPWSLALVAILFHSLGTLPKAFIWLMLALIGWLARRRDWTGRWERWTTTWTPISNLRWHLKKKEVWMAEELELLIGRANETTRMLLWPVVGGGLVLAGTSVRYAEWLIVPFILIMALLLAWPTWLNVLYGVRTWDLALMVQLALALSWPLQWLGPVRRERERLREAWERGGRNR